MEDAWGSRYLRRGRPQDSVNGTKKIDPDVVLLHVVEIVAPDVAAAATEESCLSRGSQFHKVVPGMRYPCRPATVAMAMEEEIGTDGVDGEGEGRRSASLVCHTRMGACFTESKEEDEDPSSVSSMSSASIDEDTPPSPPSPPAVRTSECITCQRVPSMPSIFNVNAT